MIELRVRPRVRVTEQDGRAAYQHWADDVKAQNPVEVRLLVKRILPGSTPEQVQAVETLAETLAHQAQTGQADFCTLVSQYTDDASTRSSCGSHRSEEHTSELQSQSNL